jgi:hypothetical protein
LLGYKLLLLLRCAQAQPRSKHNRRCRAEPSALLLFEEKKECRMPSACFYYYFYYKCKNKKVIIKDYQEPQGRRRNKELSEGSKDSTRKSIKLSDKLD